MTAIEELLLGFPPTRWRDLRRVHQHLMKWLGKDSWAQVVFPSDERDAAAVKATWFAARRAAEHPTSAVNPVGWMITTGKRYLLTEYGRGRRNRSLAGFSVAFDADSEAGEEPDPAIRAETREAEAVVQAEIAALPPDQRQAILLHLNDHTYRDIAARLGVTLATARRHCLAALTTLRLRLKERFDNEDPA